MPILLTNGGLNRYQRSATPWILVLAIVMLLLSAVPTLLSLLIVPSYWSNSPYPVSAEPLQPGNSIGVMVERCVSEPFGERTMSLRFKRNIVRDGTYERMILPEAAQVMDKGCEPLSIRGAVVPENTKPGRYYLEYIILVTGRFRVATFYARTEAFQVVVP